MSSNSLLIPYGLDPKGNIRHVDGVAAGKACGLVCAGCKEPLVARKGVKRQHHLAHLTGTSACEGWLHSTAKRLLHQRIKNAIANRADLWIEWSHVCPSRIQTDYYPIESIHKQNVLARCIDRTALERYLPRWNIRPDITCISGDKPVALIEIVVSHSPEKPVIHSKLPVIEIRVKNADDLSQLNDNTITQVAKLHNYPCPDPVCTTCRRLKSEGCRYCPHCKQHVDEHHAFCPQCDTCKEGGHRHVRCDTCNKDVQEYMVGNVYYGHYGWSHTDMHCGRCGVLFKVATRRCGCPHDYCLPCWRAL